MTDQRLLQLATELAHEAGQLLFGYAERTLDVQTKTSATDPVSEADRAAERLIAKGLLDALPDDGLLGEEDADNRRGSTGRTWIVDPLDGTVNFLYGIPAWCVSIACRDERGALVGVVHDPSRNETFTALRDGGAWLDGTEITISPVTEIERALVATGFSYGSEIRTVQGRWVADLLGQVRDIRRLGAAALDLAWTACGRFDGFYELGLQPWDHAAGALIVEEAGGVTSQRTVQVAGRTMECLLAGPRSIHDALDGWLADIARTP